MSPEQRAVIADALREVGAEQEALWVKNPDAVNRLLDLAVESGETHPRTGVTVCNKCGEPITEHDSECPVLVDATALGIEMPWTGFVELGD